MLLKIDLSRCSLGDDGVATLAQALGFRNATLQKLKLGMNSITAWGIIALLQPMEYCSLARDLELEGNDLIGDDEASFLARSLIGNNASTNLARLSLYNCGIGDGGFIALVSALEQDTSLLHLDLRYNHGFSERAFLALANSLPDIKMLQRIDLSGWCSDFTSAMPLLLAGLRKNTSLLRFHVAGCAPSSAPPTTQETARGAGAWMQEM
jgi:hypothetical protein